MTPSLAASIVEARSGRWLERALLAAFILHGLAMLGMAALLLPGTPGGSQGDVAARMAYVAAHPWLWRLGWLPWQLTALAICCWRGRCCGRRGFRARWPG